MQTAKSKLHNCIGKFLIAVLCIVCVFCGSLSVRAEDPAASTDSLAVSETEGPAAGADSFAVSEAEAEKAMALLEGILGAQCAKSGVTGLQEYLDGALSEKPLSGNTQSFIWGFTEQGYELDYSGWILSLEKAMEENEFESFAATSKQKLLILLRRIENADTGDTTSEAIRRILDRYGDHVRTETIGQQGIMSYIWGLMMLTSEEAAIDAGRKAENDSNADGGAADAQGDAAVLSTETAIRELLTLQLVDGGFALTGDAGDVDITAMALQALAPYRGREITGNDEVLSVDAAIENAWAFLRAMQLPGGDFGTSAADLDGTSESTSQVILAVCAYGDVSGVRVDSLLDGLAAYRTEEGGIAHLKGGKTNEMACSQAVCALTAILGHSDGHAWIANEPDTDKETPGTGNDELNADMGNSGTDTGESGTGGRLRPFFTIAVWVLVCAYIVVQVFMRRKGKAFLYRTLGVLAAGVAATALIWFVKPESREAYLNGGTMPETEKTVTVTLEIRCDTLLEFYREKDSDSTASDAAASAKKDLIPEDGAILARTEYRVPEGSSVLELLDYAARQQDIQLDYTGGTVAHDFAYVKGIAYLYELDYGDLSGWMYMVNGEFPRVGCGEYELSAGDEVTFVYTRDLGKDVGDSWK